jgi:hypothetical protein
MRPAGCPHDARNPPTGFEWGALLAPELTGSSVGIGVLPGTVVGGEDDDRVGGLGADCIHNATDVVVEFHELVRVVAEPGLALEHF